MKAAAAVAAFSLTIALLGFAPREAAKTQEAVPATKVVPAQKKAQDKAAPDAKKSDDAKADVKKDEAKAADDPTKPLVVTIQGEQITAVATAIEDGKLVVATDPPRKIPLDEIERLRFGAAAVNVEARWIGQDNHDVVKSGGDAGASGIQDMHIALKGLPAGRKIKQIVASCPLTKQPDEKGIWKLDTSNSPNWRMAMEQPAGAASAELYLEPNQDCFDLTFKLTVSFEDGGNTIVNVKATTHTDMELKAAAKTDDSKPNAAVETGAVRVTVRMEGGDLLRGELVALTKEVATVRTAWAESVEVPLLGVQAIEFGTTTPEEQQKLAAKLKSPGAEDVAVVRGQDNAVTEVVGNLDGFADGKLRFMFQGELRSINQPRLVGLVFAAHAPTRGGTAPYQVFNLASDDRLSGTWTAIEGETLTFTASGKAIKLPKSGVTEITFRNGKMVYLTDMEPESVEEVPYFGRLLTWRRDVNLIGEPLKMKGTTYAKGLAMHSRCVQTYAIAGGFESFKCLVGFDESAGPRGRVAVRVLGDGKELFAEKNLRADQDPMPFDVKTAGVKSLVLEVDFGEDEDIGDRVIWAEPRLFRAGAK